MKLSCFKNTNNNINHDSFSCQRQSISSSHKIWEFYGSPKGERNFQGALLLGKEIVK